MPVVPYQHAVYSLQRMPTFHVRESEQPVTSEIWNDVHQMVPLWAILRARQISTLPGVSKY